jgi:hypothetical protein
MKEGYGSLGRQEETMMRLKEGGSIELLESRDNERSQNEKSQKKMYRCKESERSTSGSRKLYQLCVVRFTTTLMYFIQNEETLGQNTREFCSEGYSTAKDTVEVDMRTDSMKVNAARITGSHAVNVPSRSVCLQ